MDIKVTIKIGDREVEFTVEELRQLFTELSKFFKFEIAPSAPVYRREQ